MKCKQFVYYIFLGLDFPSYLEDTCALPRVGFFRIKDSPYILIIQS